MSQHNEVVERQRQLIAAEKWAKGIKAIHAHSLTSLWYDDRGNDGSVCDTEYNSGLIEREIRKTGETVYFGEPLTGDALINQYTRAGRQHYNMSDLDLNDTLEEQLRHMLVDKNNECNGLKAQIKMLKESVAQEQEAKYRAYERIADLTNTINKGKND